MIVAVYLYWCLTFEEGCQVWVDSDWSECGVLSDADLEEEAWQSDEEQHERVGNQECAAAVLVAQIREAPHIAQTYEKKENKYLFMVIMPRLIVLYV